jgi:hypothetical protein
METIVQKMIGFSSSLEKAESFRSMVFIGTANPAAKDVK